MIVIADTSPINYLVLIDHIHILPALFGRVIFPQAVLKELQSTKAPDEVRRWIATNPDWIEVKTVEQFDPTLAYLDEGEREAISLAQQIASDLIILDESRGRQAASRLGLNVTGTLGLLDRAGAGGLIDAKPSNG